MEAFVRMKAYGIDPTDGALQTLGDTASGMGKDVMAAVESLADAVTGEFERLKEFGIKSSQKGGFVTFTYQNIKSGKEMSVKVKKNAAEIRAALLGIWKGNYGGGMDAMSRTMTGRLSNISDAWGRFQRKIGDAGFFAHVSERIGRLLAWLDTKAGKAKLEEWAKKTSAALIRLATAVEKFVGSIDWPRTIASIAAFAEGLTKVWTAVGGLGGVIDAAVILFIANLGLAALGSAAGIAALATAFLGFDVAIAPVVLIIAAVALAIAGIYLAIRHWDVVWRALVKTLTGFTPAQWLAGWEYVKGFFSVLWPEIKRLFSDFIGWAVTKLTGFTPAQWLSGWNTVATWFTKVWADVTKAFDAGVKSVWSVLPPWFRKILQGAAFAVKFLVNPVGAGVDIASRAAKAAPRAPVSRAPARVSPRGQGEAAARGLLKRFGASDARPAEANVNGKLAITVHSDGRPPTVRAQSRTPGWEMAVMRGALGALV
ncbi:MAG: hypothetical protein ACXW3D_10990 [Caulobacteraceae bacterium]